MNIYEGDLASIPTVLPGEEVSAPNADEENVKEELYYAQLQQEVNQGIRDEADAEELLWAWRAKRHQVFGECILRAS